MNYKLLQKINPQDKTAPEKYYATAVNTGTLTLRELAEEISDFCTLTVPDIIAVLEALLGRLPIHLMNGHTIRLGDFGSVRLTIRSKGEEDAADFSADENIRSVHVCFLASPELKHRLKKTSFKKIG